jgi:hypothetical protein
MAHQPAQTPQFQFNIPSTAPVGAHQTFGKIPETSDCAANMKHLIFLLLFWPFLSLRGEGIASSTIVSAKNVNNLDYHKVEVKRTSANGSYLSLVIRPDENHPLESVFIKIFDESGLKIVAKFHPKIEKTIDGYRVGFWIVDELLDRTVISYDLYAGKTNNTQVHFFRIPKEQLREVLRSQTTIAEQAGAGQPATKPADKPAVKDQPSTLTPKDLPR